MDLNEFKTDKGKEQEGIWEDLGGDLSVLVARWGNLNMQKEYQKYPRVLRMRLESGQTDDDQSDEIMCTVISKTIFLGWKGLKEDGVDVEYSEEEAKRILQDYPDFRSMIFDIANTAANYHAISVAGTAKNSKRGSSGN